MKTADRVAIVLMIMALAVAALANTELPDPPEGFAWRQVKAIQGAFLVPNGWHFRAESGKGTLAYFITEDEFSPPESYLVGVNINVFLNNESAPGQVEQFLVAQSEAYGVELVSGGFGPFLTLQCEYEVPPAEGHEATRVLHLGVVNPETHASYLVMFESPASQWDRTWPKGEIVTKMLALSGDV